MLVQVAPGVSVDGNKIECLPYAEAKLRYQAEQIEPLHETYRLWDHEDLKNLHKRSGIWMHSSELIYRVQKLNPRIFVEQQINYPDEWGFYGDVLGKQRYISGFNKGWLREFTAILVDQRNLQEGDELRGWRHVLLKLLSADWLTWEQVQKEFGDSEGINAYRWKMYTHQFRN
jgi:hypothetical protein